MPQSLPSFIPSKRTLPNSIQIDSNFKIGPESETTFSLKPSIFGLKVFSFSSRASKLFERSKSDPDSISPNVLTFSVVNRQGHGDDLKPIYDGGANRTIFPEGYPGLSNFKPHPSTATMADGVSSLNIYGSGKFGLFEVVVADVQRPIISEPYMLTQYPQLSIEKRNKCMYVIDGNSIVSTGSLSPDIGLYIVDNIEELLNWEPILNIEIAVTSVDDNLQISSEDTSPNPLANASPEYLRNGSYRPPYGPTRVGVQALDVLHVCWGHLPEREIKRIVKLKLVAGLHCTYEEIKNQHLRLCHSCMAARMRAFSVPRSIAPIVIDYRPFAYVSFDIISFKIRSKGGYLHIVLYVDRKTGMLFAYKCRFKSELLSTLKRLILEHGPTVNSMASRLQFLNCDSGSEQLGSDFLNYCSSNNILLKLAPPKKQVYDHVESYVNSVCSGMRAALEYNQAPLIYWLHAVLYHLWTYNRLPAHNQTVPRITRFDGTIADLSNAVPFYSSGFYNVTEQEKVSKRFSVNGVPCTMIGYADAVDKDDVSQIGVDVTVSYKQSYICLDTTTGATLIRHDCFFPIYQTHTGDDLLRADPKKRVGYIQPPIDYDQLLDQTTMSTSPLEKTRMKLRSHDQKLASSNSVDSIQDADVYSDEFPYFVPSTESIEEMHNHVYVLAVRLKSRSNNLDFPPLGDILSIELPDMQWQLAVPKSMTLPKSVEEALTMPDASSWKISYIRETANLLKKGTWETLSLEIQDEHRNKALRSMFVPKIKKEQVGNSSLIKYRFRSRLTAKGYSQQQGVNYDETYAPTARFESICVILLLVTVHGWDFSGIDIENAFVEGTLSETIYMMLPEDVFRNPDGSSVIVRLLKTLYGLKQASRVFYKMIVKILLELGLKPTLHDPCIFVFYDPVSDLITIVILWVDDVGLTGSDIAMIEHIIAAIRAAFAKIVHTEVLTTYVGLNIFRDRAAQAMSLSQGVYLRALTSRYIKGDVTTKSTPMTPSMDVRTLGDGTLEPMYQQAGEISYPADRVRPEIKFPASALKSAASNPTTTHERAFKRTLRYLAKDPDTGLTFRRGASDEIALFGIADGSNIRGHDSLSQLAYCFFLNLFSGTICARSVKSKKVSTSPAETELDACVLAIKSMIFLRGLLTELHHAQSRPSVLYTDSSVVLDWISDNSRHSKRADHLVLAINFVKQQVELGVVELRHIDTDSNTADVMTKNLPLEPFLRHKHTLLQGHDGVQPISSKLPMGHVVASQKSNPLTAIMAKQRKQKRANSPTAQARFEGPDSD